MSFCISSLMWSIFQESCSAFSCNSQLVLSSYNKGGHDHLLYTCAVLSDLHRMNRNLQVKLQNLHSFISQTSEETWWLIWCIVSWSCLLKIHLAENKTYVYYFWDFGRLWAKHTPNILTTVHLKQKKTHFVQKGAFFLTHSAVFTCRKLMLATVQVTMCHSILVFSCWSNKTCQIYQASEWFSF